MPGDRETYSHKRKLRAGLVWPLSVVLLIGSGIAYRVLAVHLETFVSTPINLPVPLSEFPMQVDKWVGKDMPIRETVQRVAGNDDFFNRLYVNGATNQWANVYVAYTARPRTMMGHRPQVCYPAHGWIHDSTEHKKMISRRGLEIPYLLHRFHQPPPRNEEMLVLNFYIVNGQLTDDESVFSGVGWRTPNIAGDPARYVAQVQFSSILENSLRSAAQDFSYLILDYFPGSDGTVRAAVRSQKLDFRSQKSEVRKR